MLLPACVLVACGGGAASTNHGAAAAAAANLRVTFVIPARSTQKSARKPAFVSSGTGGAEISIYLHSDTAHAKPLAQTVAAVTAGSADCPTPTAGSGTTCTIPLAVPAPTAGASYDIVADLFAQVPVNQQLPSGAVPIGIGELQAQPILANQQNVLAVTIDGVPATATVALSSGAVATLGTAATLPLSVTVDDATGATITGTYATPLTLTTSNQHHTSFLVNGVAGTTILASTDTIAVVYDGATITATTISVTGTSGTVSPLAFTPTSAPVITASVSSLTLSLSGPTTGSIVISETGHTGAYTGTSGCPAVFSITPVTPTPGADNQTFTVAAIATGSCSATFSDGNGQSTTVTVSVVGPLIASPGSFTIATNSNETVTVTDPDVSGTIASSLAPSCAGVATVSPATASGPTGIFTIAGVGIGSCTVTFTDPVGSSTFVTATVQAPGITITPGTPGYQEFTETLPINGQTSLAITASEPGYNGTFYITTSGCTGGTLPLVSPTSGVTTFTLYRPYPSTTQTGCGFDIVDNNSPANYIEVSVTAPAPNALSLSQNSLSITASGAVTAFESGYTYGSGFTISNGCSTAGIAVTPGTLSNGSQNFTLTSSASTSGSCGIDISDAYGQLQTLTVGYVPVP